MADPGYYDLASSLANQYAKDNIYNQTGASTLSGPPLITTKPGGTFVLNLVKGILGQALLDKGQRDTDAQRGAIQDAVLQSAHGQTPTQPDSMSDDDFHNLVSSLALTRNDQDQSMARQIHLAGAMEDARANAEAPFKKQALDFQRTKQEQDQAEAFAKQINTETSPSARNLFGQTAAQQALYTALKKNASGTDKATTSVFLSDLNRIINNDPSINLDNTSALAPFLKGAGLKADSFLNGEAALSPEDRSRLVSAVGNHVAAFEDQAKAFSGKAADRLTQLHGDPSSLVSPVTDSVVDSSSPVPTPSLNLPYPHIDQSIQDQYNAQRAAEEQAAANGGQ